MTKDLGTYFFRIELENGDGFIQETHTGWRYTDGRGVNSPLNAVPIPPTWDDENDLIATMLYQYTEGNFSCDCNKTLFLQDAHQIERERVMDEGVLCGDTLATKKITMIRPDRTEKVLYINS